MMFIKICFIVHPAWVSKSIPLEKRDLMCLTKIFYNYFASRGSDKLKI